MLAVVDGKEIYVEAPCGDEETDTYDTLRVRFLEEALSKGLSESEFSFLYDFEHEK